MQVQLKQREIEESVKGYLVKQGINLTGKAVTVGFTAGRSDRGLTAEIDIEEAPSATECHLVYSVLQPPTTDSTPRACLGLVDAGEADEPEVRQEPEIVEAEANLAPATKTTSLFG